MTGKFALNEDLTERIERSIDSNSRQFMGSYLTKDGTYDIHLTATLQGAKLIAGRVAGPYPKDVSQCMGCDADVVWMKTKNQKSIPVNVVPTESKYRGPNAGELKFVFGDHQCHFDTCMK